MEKFIIDGNNLMHKIPHVKDSREAVVEAVRARLAPNKKALFVFDGHGEDTAEVKFSGSKTADEIIRSYIKENPDDKKLTIVSSDNYITGLAKVCSCRLMKSEDFWESISANDGVTPDKNVNQLFIYDDEKPTGLSKKDLKEFKKYFT